MEELSIKNKELLFNDLCARLPYGVIVKYKSREKEGNVKMTHGNIGYVAELGNGWWKECKPYLRTLSSMTEEEYREWHYLYLPYPRENEATEAQRRIDWLNKYHFDYRGLIEKGLAIEVTEENNPYK